MPVALAWVLGMVAIFFMGRVSAGAEDDVARLVDRLGSADPTTRAPAEERLSSLLHDDVTRYGRSKASRDETIRRKALDRLRKRAALLASACGSENPFRRFAACRIRTSLRKRVRTALVLVSMRDGDRRLLALDSNGKFVWDLAAAGGEVDWPCFSPSGDRISFVRRNGSGRLCVVDAAGTRERCIVNDVPTGGRAAWSPDGRSICYLSRREGNAELYVVSAAGGESRRLTFREADDFGPRWSPNGSVIAFETYEDGDREVFVVDAAGGRPRNLSRRRGKDRDPRWSPDGSRIAFAAREGKTGAIVVVKPDGLKPLRVTKGDHLDHQPRWSPDGRMLAYTSYRRTKFGKTNVLCVVDTRDLRVIQVTPSERNNWAWNSEWWSATEVAFERTREFCPRHEQKICILDIRFGVERVIDSEYGFTCSPRFSLAPVRLDDIQHLFGK